MINAESRILLLGTMPGEESLRKQQYYGHRQNQFWKIIYSLFGKELTDDYEERKAFVLRHNIAIWDVLQSCEGSGSLDSNIKNQQPNDFSSFFRQYPLISHVCFTSKKAADFYKRYVWSDENRVFVTLPSPSPANAQMRFDEKVDKWKILLDILSTG